MNTHQILLKAAQTAKTYAEAQRIDHLTLLAHVLGRISQTQAIDVAMTINKNEAVDSDYWRGINEHEENQLKATGRLY